MVWGGSSGVGKTELAILVGNQKFRVLHLHDIQVFAAFCSSQYGTEFLFQQDNAAIHTSSMSTDFFAEQGVNVMDQPARSPDLNPIENMWAIISKEVYRNGKQYDSVSALTSTVIKAWKNIQQETLVTLIDFIPHRCIEVLRMQGNKTRY